MCSAGALTHTPLFLWHRWPRPSLWLLPSLRNHLTLWSQVSKQTTNHLCLVHHHLCQAALRLWRLCLLQVSTCFILIKHLFTSMKLDASTMAMNLHGWWQILPTGSPRLLKNGAFILLYNFDRVHSIDSDSFDALYMHRQLRDTFLLELRVLHGSSS